MSLRNCRVVIVAGAAEGELPPSLVLALEAERLAVKLCEAVVRRLEASRPFTNVAQAEITSRRSAAA